MGAELALAVVCVATPAARNALAVTLAGRSRGRYLVGWTESGLHGALRTICVRGALQARRRHAVFDVCHPERAEFAGCALVTQALDEVFKAGVAHTVRDGGRPRAIQRRRVAGARQTLQCCRQWLVCVRGTGSARSHKLVFCVEEARFAFRTGLEVFDQALVTRSAYAVVLVDSPGVTVTRQRSATHTQHTQRRHASGRVAHLRLIEFATRP